MSNYALSIFKESRKIRREKLSRDHWHHVKASPYLLSNADGLSQASACKSRQRSRSVRPTWAGAVLRWGRGHVPPRFTCCPQIQKLADHSDVISEVSKCSKILIFRGSAPDRAGGTYRSPIWLGGARCPLPRTSPLPCFYGSQGPTHYRVGNPTNDRFEM